MPEDHTRAVAVGMYLADFPVERIADFLKVSRYKVEATIARFENTELFCDRPRAGRPKTFTKRDERVVKYHAARDIVISAAAVAREMKADRRCVSHALRSSKFHAYSDRVVPVIDRRFKQHRKALYDKMEKIDWDNVIYTDEKSFTCHPDGRVKIYARSTEEYMRKHKSIKMRGWFSVRVWGAISTRGTGPLIFLKGGWGSQEYVDQVLRPALGTKRAIRLLHHSSRYIPKHWRFQQDNDSAHRGGAAMKFFEENHIPLLKWPPRSPDLNPIENVWSMMVRQIREEQVRHGGTWTEQRLRSAILAAWSSITPEQFRTLCASVPARLENTKAHGWLPTK